MGKLNRDRGQEREEIVLYGEGVFSSFKKNGDQVAEKLQNWAISHLG